MNGSRSFLVFMLPAVTHGRSFSVKSTDNSTIIGVTVASDEYKFKDVIDCVFTVEILV